MGKSFFILTDLEGVAGVDSFTQTRPGDGHPERIEEARKLLAEEVNACIEGIRSVYPDCSIDVWDGHGPGGLNAADVRGGRYLREGRPYMQLAGCDAMLFVGQHAMAGTFHAPLNHTYSSMSIAYFRLNGVFVGEFAARALIAGLQGVPTVFLSGDDKAALEAKLFVPQIETAVVKYGRGVEKADHLSREAACRVVREGAASAVRRIADIPVFTALHAPFELEIGYLHEVSREEIEKQGMVWINEFTARMQRDSIMELPL